jgi:hypothetical protein
VGAIAKKSQVAVEFILMVSLALITLLVLIGVLYYLFFNYSEENNINKLNDLGYSLQSEIILASEVEPGYERNITMPEDVGGADYSIRISDEEVVITYRGMDFLFAIPQVSGIINTKGNHVIRKTGASTITVS